MPRTRAAWKEFLAVTPDCLINKETAEYIVADWEQADAAIQAVLTQNETVRKEKVTK